MLKNKIDSLLCAMENVEKIVGNLEELRNDGINSQIENSLDDFCKETFDDRLLHAHDQASKTLSTCINAYKFLVKVAKSTQCYKDFEKDFN